MTIQVLMFAFVAGALPAEETAVEAWLDDMPACHHQIGENRDAEKRPSSLAIASVVESASLTPVHALRAIEQLSASHTGDAEGAQIVAVLKRVAESPERLRLRVDMGEEVDEEQAAAYERWLLTRIRKVAVDALATHSGAQSREILTAWAAGRDPVLAPRAQRALQKGERR